MRSLCSGRKQTSAPPPKLSAHSIVELSLLSNIAPGIHSALFSSFTASLTCISLLLESLSFPCTVWLHNRLSNRLHIHTDTFDRAEPHLSFISIAPKTLTPHPSTPPQWFSSRISSTSAKKKSVSRKTASAPPTGRNGGPTQPKGSGLQVSLYIPSQPTQFMLANMPQSAKTTRKRSGNC